GWIRPADSILGLRRIVDLDDSVQRGINDGARHALAVEQRLLRLFSLRPVAADEQMQLFRLRPYVAPGRRYEPPILVNAASLEIAPLLPAARQPNLCPHRFEIAGIGEFVPVAPDHFFRIVAQDRLATRTDAKELARMVRRQNQIRRRIE